MEKAMAKFANSTNGSIIALRIFFDDASEHPCAPMAEVVYANGTTSRFRWDNIEAREAHMPYVNAYTLIYDERPKRAFCDWIKK